jgi:predicted DCC family thiol-disulfide oxidoreductase YuxK
MMDDSRPLEVWVDGDCNLCQRSQAWCEQRDGDGILRFRDFRTADRDDLPASYAQHEGSMWVREADGSLAEGFSGWRLITQRLPGWRWLAVAAGYPPLSWIGPPLYRLVARIRYLLA